MKTVLKIILFIVMHSSFGQKFLIDERDSVKYGLVQIGNDLWFQDNLRFVTPTSWCAETPDSQACENGNYYYPTDIISICPKGWKVPTWKDYKDALRIIEEYYELKAEYSKGEVPLYKSLKLDAEQVQGLTLISDSVFFNMVPTGWVEGEEWQPQNQTTMWIVSNFSNTPQPHVHVTSDQVTMHSHGHNVLDKPKNMRRFAVRCIKCQEE